MTAAELNPELRKLIDARLDAIDRILIGAQISWSERRSIVGEVETQVFELLARRSTMPTFEDVLAVVESLDPPESYVPEELRAPLHSAPPEGTSTAATTPGEARWRELPRHAFELVAKIVPKALGAIALVIVNGIVVMIIIASNGLIPWLATSAGLVWLNIACIRRFRAWSATRQGHIIDELRHSLATWLMPKNGTQIT